MPSKDYITLPQSLHSLERGTATRAQTHTDRHRKRHNVCVHLCVCFGLYLKQSNTENGIETWKQINQDAERERETGGTRPTGRLTDRNRTDTDREEDPQKDQAQTR